MFVIKIILMKINNIKFYYITKNKTEIELLLRQRYDLIVNTYEASINKINESVTEKVDNDFMGY